MAGLVEDGRPLPLGTLFAELLKNVEEKIISFEYLYITV